MSEVIKEDIRIIYRGVNNGRVEWGVEFPTAVAMTPPELHEVVVKALKVKGVLK